MVFIIHRNLCDRLETGDVIRVGGKRFTIEVADTFISRFLGLMGRRRLPPHRALLITRCSSIHTFFMRFRMTAVFLSGSLCVTKVVPDIPPWRIALALNTKPRTYSVLEIASDESLEISEGEIVMVVERKAETQLPEVVSG